MTKIKECDKNKLEPRIDRKKEGYNRKMECSGMSICTHDLRPGQNNISGGKENEKNID